MEQKGSYTFPDGEGSHYTIDMGLDRVDRYGVKINPDSFRNGFPTGSFDWEAFQESLIDDAPQWTTAAELSQMSIDSFINANRREMGLPPLEPRTVVRFDTILAEPCEAQQGDEEMTHSEPIPGVTFVTSGLMPDGVVYVTSRCTCGQPWWGIMPPPPCPVHGVDGWARAARQPLIGDPPYPMIPHDPVYPYQPYVPVKTFTITTTSGTVMTPKDGVAIDGGHDGWEPFATEEETDLSMRPETV